MFLFGRPSIAVQRIPRLERQFTGDFDYLDGTVNGIHVD